MKLIEIESTCDSGSVLVVGDSYTNCIDYLFASVYRHVYIIDPRHYRGTLDSFLKDHDVDDAVFIMSSNNLTSQSFSDFLAPK